MRDVSEPKRTTIILAPELQRRMKIRAVEEGRTFTALVTDALEEYLRRAAKRPKGGASDGRRAK